MPVDVVCPCQECWHRGIPRRVVSSNRDVLLPESAWLYNALVGRHSVCRGESAVEAAMCSLQEFAGRDVRFGRMGGFQLALSVDMCDGNPLPLSNVRLLREVLLQRPRNVRRVSALAC